MNKTTIAWTDRTWCPVRGCSHVSAGCTGCYAERMAARFSKPGMWGHGYAEMTAHGPRWTGRVELIPGKLDEPLRLREPQRIFVNSTSDLFHEALPDEAIDRVFAVMALAPQHTFQVLTKRPARMRAWFARRDTVSRMDVAVEQAMLLPKFDGSGRMCFAQEQGVEGWPLPNVWLGVSVEDQKTADERIPLLLQTPAAARFVSVEPLLGPVDFRNIDWNGSTGLCVFERCGASLDQVIVGGESGPGARPCDVSWIRSVVRQCRDAGVACLSSANLAGACRLSLSGSRHAVRATSSGVVAIGCHRMPLAEWRAQGAEIAARENYGEAAQKEYARLLDVVEVWIRATAPIEEGCDATEDGV